MFPLHHPSKSLILLCASPSQNENYTALLSSKSIIPLFVISHKQYISVWPTDPPFRGYQSIGISHSTSCSGRPPRHFYSFRVFRFILFQFLCCLLLATFCWLTHLQVPRLMYDAWLSLSVRYLESFYHGLFFFHHALHTHIPLHRLSPVAHHPTADVCLSITSLTS